MASGRRGAPRVFDDAAALARIAEFLVDGKAKTAAEAARLIAKLIVLEKDGPAPKVPRGERRRKPEETSRKQRYDAEVKATQKRLARKFGLAQAALLAEATQTARGRKRQTLLSAPPAASLDPRRQQALSTAERLEELADQAQLLALALRAGGWGTEANRRRWLRWADIHLRANYWPPFE
ncbi:hypothetical protein [Neoroseomonas oryzicola]|uniref:Uncharacterized protein n=1 Tax=Neoroseomonas oryzicola TaxID=535904 RepID=A0A9X9WIR0_9PROT|nr:hypothetical protein [Neoroseomonas oryzicola]MBR0660220.1 hypothetical protein [Neoroseomonas oryzicola]NKE16705.1 hypothetical protein [Neoroseomonas oryzicola]